MYARALHKILKASVIYPDAYVMCFAVLTKLISLIPFYTTIFAAPHLNLCAAYKE